MRQNQCNIHESVVTIEGQRVKTYGITVTGPESTDTIADISPDSTEVAQLCARLNRADISPLHLRDAVCDYLESTGRIG